MRTSRSSSTDASLIRLRFENQTELAEDLKDDNPKWYNEVVAHLGKTQSEQGAWNSSSGEAVVIAFKGRPDTRSFGDRTCGKSTANELYPMSDGATLNLTGAVMADRNRTPYGSFVQPDENVPGIRVVERAVEWLRTGT